MKNIKRILCIALIFVMLMSVNAFAYTMYAPDGRAINVAYNDAQAWRNVGWYDAPVTVMYAPDGRTIVVYTSDVPAWEKVGWSTNTSTQSGTNYKNEYAYVLNQIMADDSYKYDASFSLVYIDGDDIPELVYRHDECHAAAAEVFTFSGGRAVKLGTFGEFGDIYYKPKANRFTSQYWGMGAEYIDLFNISNGSAIKLVGFSGYEGMPGDSSYSVNNQPVTYSRYMATKSSYGLGSDWYEISNGFVRAGDTNKYSLNYATISRVLQ